MKSSDVIEYETMSIVAEHLGEGWRDVFRKLGFSDGQIESSYEQDFPKGLREVKYQLLRQWKERDDEEATFGKMTTILWRNGHKETVYLLKEIWRARKSKSSDSQNDNQSNEYRTESAEDLSNPKSEAQEPHFQKG